LPRRYRLGKRAELKDSTRGSIVDAAIALYTEQGISHTSMAQIAHRADVAPATVLNHFATREDLDRALVERAFAQMRAPDISIFDGLTTLAERVRALSRETGAFLDRSEPWYLMWRTDPMNSGVWAEAGASYGRRWELLFRWTLGGLAENAEAMAVLQATMDPQFWNAFRQGRTTRQVADLIADLITLRLEQLDALAKERAKGSRATPARARSPRKAP